MYAASRRFWVAGFIGLAAFGAGDAQAASSVLIWPIDPVLEADQQASALWLENRGSETASLQIRVFAWSQSGFDEQYQNQRDVIGSPPVAKIEPGQKQLVRLTRTKEVPPGQELAYRIIIDEIPAAAPEAPAADGKTAAAIRFQMRYSVPLFAYGAGLWSKEDASRQRDPKGAGKPDLSKGSYYNNPQYNVPFEDAAIVEQYPAFAHPNIWPTEHVPALEVSSDGCRHSWAQGAFLNMGRQIVDVGQVRWRIRLL